MTGSRLNAGYAAIGLIIVGLIFWGALHAIGTYSLNRNPWRAVVVVGFSLAFVLFWLTLLWQRGRKRSHQRPTERV